MINPIKALTSSLFQTGPMGPLGGLPGQIAQDITGIAGKLSPSLGAKLGSALGSLGVDTGAAQNRGIGF